MNCYISLKYKQTNHILYSEKTKHLLPKERCVNGERGYQKKEKKKRAWKSNHLRQLEFVLIPLSQDFCQEDNGSETDNY